MKITQDKVEMKGKLRNLWLKNLCGTGVKDITRGGI